MWKEKVNKESRAKLQEGFGVHLQVLKNQAGQLGLWRTMHAMDKVTKVYIQDVMDLKKIEMPKHKKKSMAHLCKCNHKKSEHSEAGVCWAWNKKKSNQPYCFCNEWRPRK